MYYIHPQNSFPFAWFYSLTQYLQDGCLNNLYLSQQFCQATAPFSYISNYFTLPYCYINLIPYSVKYTNFNTSVKSSLVLLPFLRVSFTFCSVSKEFFFVYCAIVCQSTLYAWISSTQVLLTELQVLRNTWIDIIYTTLLKLSFETCHLTTWYFYSFFSFDQICKPSLTDERLNLPKSKDF